MVPYYTGYDLTTKLLVIKKLQLLFLRFFVVVKNEVTIGTVSIDKIVETTKNKKKKSKEERETPCNLLQPLVK